jgi:hypothetical protein
VLAAVLVLAATIVLPAAEARPARSSRARIESALATRIARQRRLVWRWQRLMGQRLSGGGRRVSGSLAHDRRLLRLWQRRARATLRRAAHPPHRSAWLCIHRGEGAWNDPAPPYYGGLQMDIEFQRSYGLELLRSKGTADHWTPLEQMWVAERAFSSGRGFSPWPNTAARCGLY